MVIRYQGELYQIAKYDHVTPGNWRAIHHLNLRSLKTGRQKDVRMSTSDVIEPSPEYRAFFLWAQSQADEEKGTEPDDL